MQEASRVRSDRVTSSFVGVEIALRALGWPVLGGTVTVLTGTVFITGTIFTGTVLVTVVLTAALGSGRDLAACWPCRALQLQGHF